MNHSINNISVPNDPRFKLFINSVRHFYLADIFVVAIE